MALTKAKAPRLVSALEQRLGEITDVAELEKLLVELGLVQNDETVEAAISHHRG